MRLKLSSSSPLDLHNDFDNVIPLIANDIGDHFQCSVADISANCLLNYSSSIDHPKWENMIIVFWVSSIQDDIAEIVSNISSKSYSSIG